MAATAAVRTSNFRYPKQWIGDAAPTITNDSNNGYGVGDVFTDKTNKRAYICTTSTAGAAVWNPVGIATADIGTPTVDPGNGGTVAVTEQGCEGYHKTTFTFAALKIATTDHTTAGGHASLKLYDFPEGMIRIKGVVVNLTLLASGTTTLTTNASLVGSLGTAAVGVDNDTLLSTEADVIPSTACTLTSFAGAFVAINSAPIVALTDSSGGTASNTLAAIEGTYTEATLENTVASLAAKINELVALSGGGKAYDGTGTAKDLYINFAVADAGHGTGTNGMLALTGTVQVLWENYGDK